MKPNWCIFPLKMMNYWKNVTIFGIKSAIIWNCKPIYNKKFLKTKMKSYLDKAADFRNEEISKVGSNYTCLAVIWIDFILKKDENCSLQVLFRECKYIEK